MQRGFLPGRSTLANVVEDDTTMRQMSAEQLQPAAIFYDFQAAFPSLAHDFLLGTLKALKLPAAVVCFVRRFYQGHGCRRAPTDAAGTVPELVGRHDPELREVPWLCAGS